MMIGTFAGGFPQDCINALPTAPTNLYHFVGYPGAAFTLSR